MVWSVANLSNSKSIFPLDGFRLSTYYQQSIDTKSPIATTTELNSNNTSSNSNNNDIDTQSSMIVLFGGVGTAPKSNNVYTCKIHNNNDNNNNHNNSKNQSHDGQWTEQCTINSNIFQSKYRMDHAQCIVGHYLYVFGGRISTTAGLTRKVPLCHDGHVMYMLNLRSFVWSSDQQRMMMRSINNKNQQQQQQQQQKKKSNGNNGENSSSSGSRKSGEQVNRAAVVCEVPLSRYGHTLSHSYACTFPKYLFMFGGVAYTTTTTTTTSSSSSSDSHSNNSNNSNNNNNNNNNGHSASGVVRQVNELWMFNTVNNEWYSYDRFCETHKMVQHMMTCGGRWPSARHGHLAHIIDNHLYVIGGAFPQSNNSIVRSSSSSSSSASLSNDLIWKLNLSNMQWSHITVNASLLPHIPLCGSSSVVIGSKIIMYGGQLLNGGGGGGGGGHLSSLLVFDTDSHHFGMIESSAIYRQPQPQPQPQQQQQQAIAISNHSLILHGTDIWLMGGKQRSTTSLLSVTSMPSKLASMSSSNCQTYRFSLKISDPPKSRVVVSHRMVNPQTGSVFVEEEVVSQLTRSDVALRDQKIDLLCQLIRGGDTGEYHSIRALQYLRDIAHADTLHIVYWNAQVQQALIHVLKSGSEDQVMIVARILSRYVRHTDQGFIPTGVTVQMLHFIDSYLTHVDSAAKLQQMDSSMNQLTGINFQIYDQYMHRFEDLMQNYDRYQSVSKDIINVFIHVFWLSEIDHPVIVHIVHIASRALLFLANNAHNFATACKKSFCRSVNNYMTKRYEILGQQLQRQQLQQQQQQQSVHEPQQQQQEQSDSALTIEQTVNNILQSIYLLSQRSKSVARHLDYFVELYVNTMKGLN